MNTANQKQRLSRALLYSLLFGLAAHGLALTNVIAFHDNVHYFFSVGATYSSGRWFLGVLGSLFTRFFGAPNCASPLFNGLICLILSGLSAWVLAEIMDVRSRSGLLLLSGLLVASPAVAGLFGYMFTAPYYLLAQLLCLSAAWVCQRRPDALGAGAGGFLLALSIGIYQSYLPMGLCALLFAFAQELCRDEDSRARVLLLRVARYAGTAIGGFLLYFLFNQLFLHLKGAALDSYMGISQMGQNGLLPYIRRIPAAYHQFFFPGDGVWNVDLFPDNVRVLYYLCQILMAALWLPLIWKLLRASAAKGICIALVLLCYPLAANLIYVMCGTYNEMHLLMVCSLIMVFVPLPFLAEHTVLPKPGKKAVQRICAAVLALVCLSYVRFDNFAHTRMAVYQTRSIEFFNRMVLRIESTEGYSPELPLAYVGDCPNVETFQAVPGFDRDPLTPLLSHETFLYSYSWQEFVSFWCGFSPTEADPAAFRDNAEVAAMPCYPADGSIRIIGGTVVVKLSNDN